MWEIIEVIAYPDAYAVAVDRERQLHIAEIVELERRGARIIDLTQRLER